MCGAHRQIEVPEMSNNAKWKLATQNLACAYRLICPSSKSADDFDNRIVKLREQNNSEEDIFTESAGTIVDCLSCADWLDC